MDAIGSIALVFQNNVSTTKMGKKSAKELNCSLEVPAQEIVQEVRMRHNVNLNQIQNLTLITDLGTEIEFNGKNSDGQTETQSFGKG